MTRPLGRSRDGFTLIELLVMIALLATLAAIVLGAVMRVRSEQDKSFTAATLQKVDSKLIEKLKTIREQIQDRNRPIKGRSEADALTGGNSDLANAILLYLHAKNQLPMTFEEAKNSTVYGNVNGVINLPPNPSIAGRLSGIPAGTPGSPEESAICLYLALEPLGLAGLEQQVGDAPSYPGLKVFLDTYGQPVCFSRLAFGGDKGELDAIQVGDQFDPFYPKKNAPPTPGYRDMTADFGGAAAVNAFWAQVIPPTLQGNWAGIPATYPGRRFHTAAVVSVGKNKTLLDAPAMNVYGGDNIVSYRLRKDGGKGD